MLKTLFIAVLFSALPLSLRAQIGEHRNDLSIGLNGGYVLSSVGFTPKVNQGYHGGLTGGLSIRYVCEKYFNTICSIYGEVNYSQIGWKEDILDIYDRPVVNAYSGDAEAYKRTMSYIQVPVFARLGWGREERGFQFFFQAGPQVGMFLSEKTESNFTLETMNTDDRVSSVTAQDTMAVENKLDYGITAGIGIEYSHPKIGHLMLEARYYYGLGNIYGDSKRDYFGKSNFSNIVVKMTYLFDITRTKKNKINK